MVALVRLFFVSLVVLAVSTNPALAGAYVLHPSGFGAHSYSAWKGGEGLPDSVGNKDQALYFQKLTSTETFAAGVAVFKGFEGMDTADLGQLSFWYRDDGWCGAGAPRFNLRVEVVPGVTNTIFFGCNSGMVPDGATTYNGHTWFKRTTVGALPPGTVVSLAIVFDEGTTQFGLPLGQGFVYLDNITAGGHTWTSASNNGGGESIEASSVPLADLLGASLDSLFK